MGRLLARLPLSHTDLSLVPNYPFLFPPLLSIPLPSPFPPFTHQVALYALTDTSRTTRRSGIPAFDLARRLLGFYEEVLDASHATTIAFVPLGEVEVDDGSEWEEWEVGGDGRRRAVAGIVSQMEGAFAASERSRSQQGQEQGQGQGKADPFLQTFDSDSSSGSGSGSGSGAGNGTGSDGGWLGSSSSGGGVDPQACHLFSLPRSFYDKEKLKQDAMMHCWMAEMEMSFV